MCGIFGLWGLPGEPAPSDDALASMSGALRHRGPDGHGAWTDPGAGVALGHRRLSIIDLSDAGAQPMVSHDGRYVLTYNGEIYNARAIGAELARDHAVRFVGHSDTEVALAAIAQWGLREAVGRFVGMFAFALWDREARRLSFARDRLGIKPLYLARIRGGLAFASELSAIERAPSFAREIDETSLALYFRYACLPEGRSIYRDVEQLAPGSLVTYPSPTARPPTRRFWSASSVAQWGAHNPATASFEESVEALERQLGEAVRDRLVADVPLGVFLSGGIDSSVVTSLMCDAASDPREVRTFSIGFEDAGYDEAVHAEAVAQHLGTTHTQLVLTPEHAMRRVRDLGAIYAEPFADSSQLPTFLVSELAREHVTVALSGDGGDELFGGYNRHLWGPRVWAFDRAVPSAARHAVARALASRSPAEWDALAARLHVPLRTPGDKAHKLAGLLDAESRDALYLRLTSIWPDPTLIVPGADAATPSHRELSRASVGEDFMYRDLVGYLPDDILTKVDRASMAVSLEVRVPLLDHRVVELAWRTPREHKIAKGVGKRVLRAVLARHVPRSLFERPKMGFGVPIDRWLRGPLRGWAEELLDPLAIRKRGLLDAQTVSVLWSTHLEGKRPVQHQLWTVLMFQAWLTAEPGR
ncbi:MAG: asparagine synthase (glutamine-hydrolyzing) [Sandaracinaceae bacterium]